MPRRHLVDICDLSKEELYGILNLALEIKRFPKKYYGICDGRILATLFYEPSTRTQMSFQTAMLRLGGKVIGFSDPATTSVSKGESLKDTVKMTSGYADVIAIRHPYEGSARACALYSDCPVINAGDGGHMHPTQTLTDLTTLLLEKGTLNGLTVGMCGDLKNGRTVHSLIKAMSRYRTKFVLISTKELRIPDYIRDCITESGCSCVEAERLDEAIPELDVLYMTRIQRERFKSLTEYEEQKGVFHLDNQKLRLAKKELTILHPLPRVDEILVEVDEDPRAKYFEQAVNGMYARMALIAHMLDGRTGIPMPVYPPSGRRCPNTACITNKEEYLPRMQRVDISGPVCAYCESKL